MPRRAARLLCCARLPLCPGLSGDARLSLCSGLPGWTRLPVYARLPINISLFSHPRPLRFFHDRSLGFVALYVIATCSALSVLVRDLCAAFHALLNRRFPVDARALWSLTRRRRSILRPGCFYAGAWVAKTRAGLHRLIAVLSPLLSGLGIDALAAQIVVSLARSHAGISFMGAPGHDRVAAMSAVAMVSMPHTVIPACTAFVGMRCMVFMSAPEVPMMVAAPIKRMPVVVMIVVIQVSVGPRQQKKGVHAPE